MKPQSMRPVIIFPCLALVASIALLSQPATAIVGLLTAEWPQQIGTNTLDVSNSVAVEGSGNVYIRGSTRDNLKSGTLDDSRHDTDSSSGGDLHKLSNTGSRRKNTGRLTESCSIRIARDSVCPHDFSHFSSLLMSNGSVQFSLVETCIGIHTDATSSYAKLSEVASTSAGKTEPNLTEVRTTSAPKQAAVRRLGCPHRMELR